MGTSHWTTHTHVTDNRNTVGWGEAKLSRRHQQQRSESERERERRGPIVVMDGELLPSSLGFVYSDACCRVVSLLEEQF